MPVRFVLVKRAFVVSALVTAVAAAAAHAAPLPGVKTPTRNISCFYVPIKPTTRGNLLCAIRTSSYSRAEQDGCQARAGLDWHGFELSTSGKAQPVCTGGVLYDIGRDTPTFVVLAYGRTWQLARVLVHVARQRAHVHERARARPLPVARLVPARSS